MSLQNLYVITLEVLIKPNIIFILPILNRQCFMHGSRIANDDNFVTAV